VIGNSVSRTPIASCTAFATALAIGRIDPRRARSAGDGQYRAQPDGRAHRADRSDEPQAPVTVLAGHGIRGLAYIVSIGEYLVIGGPVSRLKGKFNLWLWSGQPGAQARRVIVSGLPGLEHAEGVSPAVIGGAPRIIIVSDDGNRRARRCASYLLLDPGQLQTAP
jgi:hypothetical protein